MSDQNLYFFRNARNMQPDNHSRQTYYSQEPIQGNQWTIPPIYQTVSYQQNRSFADAWKFYSMPHLPQLRFRPPMFSASFFANEFNPYSAAATIGSTAPLPEPPILPAIPLLNPYDLTYPLATNYFTAVPNLADYAQSISAQGQQSRTYQPWSPPVPSTFLSFPNPNFLSPTGIPGTYTGPRSSPDSSSPLIYQRPEPTEYPSKKLFSDDAEDLASTSAAPKAQYGQIATEINEIADTRPIKKRRVAVTAKSNTGEVKISKFTGMPIRPYRKRKTKLTPEPVVITLDSDDEPSSRGRGKKRKTTRSEDFLPQQPQIGNRYPGLLFPGNQEPEPEVICINDPSTENVALTGEEIEGFFQSCSGMAETETQVEPVQVPNVIPLEQDVKPALDAAVEDLSLRKFRPIQPKPIHEPEEVRYFSRDSTFSSFPSFESPTRSFSDHSVAAIISTATNVLESGQNDDWTAFLNPVRGHDVRDSTKANVSDDVNGADSRDNVDVVNVTDNRDDFTEFEKKLNDVTTGPDDVTNVQSYDFNQVSNEHFMGQKMTELEPLTPDDVMFFHNDFGPTPATDISSTLRDIGDVISADAVNDVIPPSVISPDVVSRYIQPITEPVTPPNSPVTPDVQHMPINLKKDTNNYLIRDQKKEEETKEIFKLQPFSCFLKPFSADEEYQHLQTLKARTDFPFDSAKDVFGKWSGPKPGTSSSATLPDAHNFPDSMKSENMVVISIPDNNQTVQLPPIELTEETNENAVTSTTPCNVVSTKTKIDKRRKSTQQLKAERILHEWYQHRRLGTVLTRVDLLAIAEKTGWTYQQIRNWTTSQRRKERMHIKRLLHESKLLGFQEQKMKNNASGGDPKSGPVASTSKGEQSADPIMVEMSERDQACVVLEGLLGKDNKGTE